jgi:hypothetical protein
MLSYDTYSKHTAYKSVMYIQTLRFETSPNSPEIYNYMKRFCTTATTVDVNENTQLSQTDGMETSPRKLSALLSEQTDICGISTNMQQTVASASIYDKL